MEENTILMQTSSGRLCQSGLLTLAGRCSQGLDGCIEGRLCLQPLGPCQLTINTPFSPILSIQLAFAPDKNANRVSSDLGRWRQLQCMQPHMCMWFLQPLAHRNPVPVCLVSSVLLYHCTSGCWVLCTCL